MDQFTNLQWWADGQAAILNDIGRDAEAAGVDLSILRNIHTVAALFAPTQESLRVRMNATGQSKVAVKNESKAVQTAQAATAPV